MLGQSMLSLAESQGTGDRGLKGGSEAAVVKEAARERGCSPSALGVLAEQAFNLLLYFLRMGRPTHSCGTLTSGYRGCFSW